MAKKSKTKMMKPREKVKWTKEMQMVKDMDAAADKLSEDDKEFGYKMAGIMKWNRWTLILIVAGVLVALLGEKQGVTWAYYLALAIWAAAMACSYIYTKARNEIAMERELKRKAEKENTKDETKIEEKK